MCGGRTCSGSSRADGRRSPLLWLKDGPWRSDRLAELTGDARLWPAIGSVASQIGALLEGRQLASWLVALDAEKKKNTGPRNRKYDGAKPWKQNPTSAREDTDSAVSRRIRRHSAVFAVSAPPLVSTRCSEDTAQSLPPSLP